MNSLPLGHNLFTIINEVFLVIDRLESLSLSHFLSHKDKRRFMSELGL